MIKNENQPLEGKLIKSIESKELSSLTSDYTELGLDSILDDGIVKDIPVLRTLVSIAKLTKNVRDRLYLKKMSRFLVQLAGTTQEQREEFIRKYCCNKKRFEETILLILEQADRISKATLIGKIFKACILGKIRYEDALLLSDMVNRCFWSDLETLFESAYNGNERLFLSGFFSLKLDSSSSVSGGELDELFQELRFDINLYGNALQLIHCGNYNELENSRLGRK
jgi:hypothetical protein